MDPEVPNVQPPTGTPSSHGVCRELLEMKGTVRAKIMAAGVGPSITHELGLSGWDRVGSHRSKNQTRCMPDLHEWVEHGQSHGGPSVTWDSPLTQGGSVYSMSTHGTSH